MLIPALLPVEYMLLCPRVYAVAPHVGMYPAVPVPAAHLSSKSTVTADCWRVSVSIPLLLSNVTPLTFLSYPEDQLALFGYTAV